MARLSVPAVVFLLGAILPAAAASAAPQEQGENDLDVAVSWMTGSFSSAAQAASDTNYFDIRLEMARVWRDRTDGYWLYVEQAVATHLEKPYRQRVYHVALVADGAVRSDVYAIPRPLRFAGEWRSANPLASLTPDSLVVREGCAVVLRRSGPLVFEGGTVGGVCASELRGASYATSTVSLMSERLVSWDRGFDEQGEQVWGATTGGYEFLRVGPAGTAPGRGAGEAVEAPAQGEAVPGGTPHTTKE